MLLLTEQYAAKSQCLKGKWHAVSEARQAVKVGCQILLQRMRSISPLPTASSQGIMWNLGKLQAFLAGSSSTHQPSETDRLPCRNLTSGFYSGSRRRCIFLAHQLLGLLAPFEGPIRDRCVCPRAQISTSKIWATRDPDLFPHSPGL